jgi:oligogalacturonide lyase
MKRLHYLLPLLGCFVAGAARGDNWISYPAGHGPGHSKHIVFLSGDEEYRSEEGLPMLAKILSRRHGFKCTVLFAVGKDGTIDPNNNTSLPGAEALDSADAIVMLVRFRHWPDEPMKHFVDAYLRGVPIIGLRTSTHAFNFSGKDKSSHEKYNDFGKKVLGERWVNHWGKHKQEATRGIIEPSAKDDPLLRGVADIFGDTDVYEAYPPPDATILVRGQVLNGMKPTDKPADYKKKRATDRQEQGINDPMMAVAWKRLNKNDAGKENKILCTTMGSATDLQSEGLRRLIVNGVYWSVGLDVPAKAEVTYVDPFKPTMYGFNGFKKGVKPADLAIKLPVGAKEAKPPQSQVRQAPLTDWIDAATGHRVVRLTGPEGGSTFYFHQNAYTAAGDKLVISTRQGLATLDLSTLGTAPPKISLVLEGRAGNVVVGKKTRQVFYMRASSIYATDLETRTTRKIAELPAYWGRGSGLAINADESLLGGSATVGMGKFNPFKVGGPGKGSLEARWAANVPMALYTVNIKTGNVNKFYEATDWLNHVQFSPTDPTLMMFCHEGPWHKVDRIWTIRIDGTGLRKIHTRTIDMEIAGHEFFSHDGKAIWYDLQTPRSKEFWLAGLVLQGGEKIRYRLQRDQWSVHFNQSPDGKHFAGDGGGPNSVAAPGNGQWIYLFTPQGDGSLKAEKLVDLSAHNYKTEPNVTFTPNGRWVVFRSNMHGPTHVYAVEVQKRKSADTSASSQVTLPPQPAGPGPAKQPQSSRDLYGDRLPAADLFHIRQ